MCNKSSRPKLGAHPLVVSGANSQAHYFSQSIIYHHLSDHQANVIVLTLARKRGTDPYTDPIELRESLEKPEGYESDKEDSKPMATKRKKVFSDEESSDEEIETDPKRVKPAAQNETAPSATTANATGQATNTPPPASGTGNQTASQDEEDKDGGNGDDNEGD